MIPRYPTFLYSSNLNAKETKSKRDTKKEAIEKKIIKLKLYTK